MQLWKFLVSSSEFVGYWPKEPESNPLVSGDERFHRILASVELFLMRTLYPLKSTTADRLGDWRKNDPHCKEILCVYTEAKNQQPDRDYDWWRRPSVCKFTYSRNGALPDYDSIQGWKKEIACASFSRATMRGILPLMAIWLASNVPFLWNVKPSRWWSIEGPIRFCNLKHLLKGGYLQLYTAFVRGRPIKGAGLRQIIRMIIPPSESVLMGIAQNQEFISELKNIVSILNQSPLEFWLGRRHLCLKG